jgi:hypothetical protein
MKTIQQYLNEKYKTKEEVKEINLSQINEQLEGGELDLSAFSNLEKLEIDPNLLSTPLKKINTQGLINLKEINWLEIKPETEEEKKLYEELGISADLEKKRVVKEVQKLADLKGIEVTFKEKEEGKIYLNLDQKDKAGNFCPNLIFWTLAKELSTISGGELDKKPSFWNNFDKELEWVKQNVSSEYFSELEQLTVPSLFPTEKLEMELLSVYYPNSEEIADSKYEEAIISKEIADKTYQTIRENLIELTGHGQELSENSAEEEIPKLAFKLEITEDNGEYNVKIHYHPQNPFSEKIRELITNTPLKLEIENLKTRQEQLPTSENFERIKKQNQAWEIEVQNLGISEETVKEVKEKIDKIS